MKKSLIDLWLIYEKDVTGLIENAVSSYSKHNSAEDVLEIGVWTDAQAFQSAVSFETVEHARRHIQESASWFQSRGLLTAAENTLERPFHVSVADFKYAGFRTDSHPELLSYLDDGNMSVDQAGIMIEEVLLRVRDRIINTGCLALLPHGGGIWFGVSSPRDWFDHVKFISLQPTTN